MTRLIRCAVALISLGLLQAAEPNAADRAALGELQSVSGLPHAVVLRRIQADAASDLVVAMASPEPDDRNPVWSPKERLGVFLQGRADPARLDTLVAEPGPNDDCWARIERLTARELVVSCTGEKWTTYDNQKFVYDIRSRKLLSHSTYPPLATALVMQGSHGPRFAMAANRRLSLLVDLDAEGRLQVAPDAEARGVLARIPADYNVVGHQVLIGLPMWFSDPPAEFGPGGRFRMTRGSDECGAEKVDISEGEGAARQSHPLPRTDVATWQRARPDGPGHFARPETAELDEVIGPHQLEGNRLWFGKTFYDAEGATGVGGFGYFDAETAAYRLYSPPELLEWSVSAILVEPDSVWLALYHRGEYGNSAGGLLRWDRTTAQVESLAVNSTIGAIVRQGDTLYLGATDGIVTVRAGRIASYFADRAADGSYRMVERLLGPATK